MCNIQVKIPKFTMNNTFKFTDMLKSISLRYVFDPDAELTRFFLPVKNEKLYISGFYHEAFITVKLFGKAILQSIFGIIIFVFL